MSLPRLIQRYNTSRQQKIFRALSRDLTNGTIEVVEAGAELEHFGSMAEYGHSDDSRDYQEWE